MDKIINDLKYFKEHIQGSKKNVGSKNYKKDVSGSLKRKGKEAAPESGDNTTAPSQQVSRPRTSRGNRTSSKASRREGAGGSSAIGFHSNLPQHHLLYNNIENSKIAHHKSVNEALDSPRSKRRKHSKGKISPNSFIVHHQRQPTALQKNK